MQTAVLIFLCLCSVAGGFIADRLITDIFKKPARNKENDMTIKAYTIPTPAPAATFLRDLTNLSRKHKIALSGEPILFEMEPEDMATEYRCDDDSVVSFG